MRCSIYLHKIKIYIPPLPAGGGKVDLIQILTNSPTRRRPIQISLTGCTIRPQLLEYVILS